MKLVPYNIRLGEEIIVFREWEGPVRGIAGYLRDWGDLGVVIEPEPGKLLMYPWARILYVERKLPVDGPDTGED